MVIALLSYLVTVAISLAILFPIYRRNEALCYKVSIINEIIAPSLLPAINVIYAIIAAAMDDTPRQIRVELSIANSLNVCKSCGRFSRLYQRKLAEMRHRLVGKRYLAHITCPHCGEDQMSFTEPDIEYAWQATHPDCPAIDKAGLYDYLKTVADAEKALKDIESIEAFRKYNKF